LTNCFQGETLSFARCRRRRVVDLLLDFGLELGPIGGDGFLVRLDRLLILMDVARAAIAASTACIVLIYNLLQRPAKAFTPVRFRAA
jgi:hypothetical protein